MSRKRREWLPNLPSQGLMIKTHDYLQYYLFKVTIFATINSEYRIETFLRETSPNIKKSVKVDKAIYKSYNGTLFRRARNCAKVLDDLVTVGS